jgi:GST-like protein
MEVKRQFHVLDTHLAEHRYLAGDDYSIADMAVWPWYGNVARGDAYPGAAEFLNTAEYTHFNRWADEVAAREPVQRGRLVNRGSGPEDQRVPERHDASDIDAVRRRQP